jgi:hypothetical protein
VQVGTITLPALGLRRTYDDDLFSEIDVAEKDDGLLLHLFPKN